MYLTLTVFSRKITRQTGNLSTYVSPPVFTGGGNDTRQNWFKELKKKQNTSVKSLFNFFLIIEYYLL